MTETAPELSETAEASEPETGLLISQPNACQGYTLIAPVRSTKTYLIDMNGRIVRTWESDFTPGLSAYLLENGNLLRPALLGGPFGNPQPGPGPGSGGRIQEFTWEGDLVWDLVCASETQFPHHDIARLPNGNILMIVWDRKSPQEAIAAGRRPDLVRGRSLWPDSLVEVRPTGKTTGEVVWEWHLWDHLIQDHDPSKANYGNVGEHPELVDINYDDNVFAAIAARKRGMDQLRSIGYVSDRSESGGPNANPVWSHLNSVTFNEELNQIMVTSLTFSEFWVIDHSTTALEAQGHVGGHSGKGGDILYRWGNPRAYRAGTKEDQRLFAAHNAHWIPRGVPGHGHVLVFNNGTSRASEQFSSVEEVAVPVQNNGSYERVEGNKYGPDEAYWTYRAPEKSTFYSTFFSGAQRLPNGNTLICSGTNGVVFEVTADNQVVWKFVNPTEGNTAIASLGRWSKGALFRAYRYVPDYPALLARDLTSSKGSDDTQGRGRAK